MINLLSLCQAIKDDWYIEIIGWKINRYIAFIIADTKKI